jgi:hypothetical protein
MKKHLKIQIQTGRLKVRYDASRENILDSFAGELGEGRDYTITNINNVQLLDGMEFISNNISIGQFRSSYGSISLLCDRSTREYQDTERLEFVTECHGDRRFHVGYIFDVNLGVTNITLNCAWGTCDYRLRSQYGILNPRMNVR